MTSLDGGGRRWRGDCGPSRVLFGCDECKVPAGPAAEMPSQHTVYCVEAWAKGWGERPGPEGPFPKESAEGEGAQMSWHPGTVGGSGKHTEWDDFEVIACVHLFKITTLSIPHCPNERIKKEVFWPIWKYMILGNSLAVRWLGLSSFTARARVQSLVGELWSHKLRCVAKKKKKKEGK